jgi:membrane protein
MPRVAATGAQDQVGDVVDAVSDHTDEVMDDANEVVRPGSVDPRVALRGGLARVPRRLRLALLITRRVLAEFSTHHGLSWSAAIAFYLVLSLPPLLIALSSIGAVLFGDESVRTAIIEQVIALLPAERGVVEGAVRDVSFGGLPALGSLVALLFVGSRILSALVEAINVMWDQEEEAGFWRQQRLRLVLLLGVGGLFAASVALEYGIGRVGDDLSLGPITGIITRFILPTVLVVAGLFLTYRLVPGERASVRSAFVGAVIGAVLLRVAQTIFTVYFTAGARFDSAYGSLAGIAILVTWALVASAMVLLGAEIVATLDRHSPVDTSDDHAPRREKTHPR